MTPPFVPHLSFTSTSLQFTLSSSFKSHSPLSLPRSKSINILILQSYTPPKMEEQVNHLVQKTWSPSPPSPFPFQPQSSFSLHTSEQTPNSQNSKIPSSPSKRKTTNSHLGHPRIRCVISFILLQQRNTHHPHLYCR